MNTLCQRAIAGILLSLILGCASTPTDQQIINLTQRIEFDGISVLPPQAKDWVLGSNLQKGIVFKKQFSGSLQEPATHTFLAGIRYADLNERAPKNSQELLAYVKSDISSKDDPRFQNISTRILLDEDRSKTLNTDCARYELVFKESANPLFPGIAFTLNAYGFQCRHPYSASIVVDAFCTERYQENNQSSNQVFRRECDTFLNDVQFKPLATQVEHLMDNTYLNVPAWDYPQWQQMVSEAKMMYGQGNPRGAEQLCSQALHNADANTIKSLYAYADLLETQQRDSSMLVRSRANKLMELRIKVISTSKPQAEWLGFLPDEMLQEYADLLETLQQNAEAQSMSALKKAYRYTQEVHAIRMRAINQGKNPWGMCFGFQDQVH